MQTETDGGVDTDCGQTWFTHTNTQLIDLILYGTEISQMEKFIELFTEVHLYITTTGRF